jgi:hypothetical protein
MSGGCSTVSKGTSVWIVLGLFALGAPTGGSAQERPGQGNDDRRTSQERCIEQLSGFPANASAQPPTEYPADLKNITLEYFASGCYGQCPAFTLTIRKDSAEFVGRAWVRKKGKHTAKISQEQFEKFLHAWFDQRFFAMRDDYCRVACPDGTMQVVTDNLETSITLNTPSFKKEVYECFTTIDGKAETPRPPEPYFELARELLAFGKIKRWL